MPRAACLDKGFCVCLCVICMCCMLCLRCLKRHPTRDSSHFTIQGWHWGPSAASSKRKHISGMWWFLCTRLCCVAMFMFCRTRIVRLCSQSPPLPELPWTAGPDFLLLFSLLFSIGNRECTRLAQITLNRGYCAKQRNPQSFLLRICPQDASASFSSSFIFILFIHRFSKSS